MIELVRPFSSIASSDLPVVGGKGANLGEMTRVGLPVPPGFCITTAAFDLFCAGVDGFSQAIGELDRLGADDVARVREHAARLRERCLKSPVPAPVEEAVRQALAQADLGRAYAVRSSATLEDLPGASFAGQQDTFLNLRGEADILQSVVACFASLYTDRAVLYRRQHGFRSRGAQLAVVVQQMAEPEISGILFTADPISGHRGICTIDASWGLGEALVSGLVNADLYRVDKASGEILSVHVGDKRLGIFALPEGGTEERALAPEQSSAQVLDADALRRLVALARKVEDHYGSPQDIEWCLEAGGELRLVQTRPITSLFGRVEPVAKDGFHVYASFNHMQVMTDPMLPFGASAARYLIPLGKNDWHEPCDVMFDVDHRLYADLTPALHRFPFSKLLPAAMEAMDPIMASTLREVMQRAEFKGQQPPSHIRRRRLRRQILKPVLKGVLKNFTRRDFQRAAPEFVEHMQSAVAQWRKRIADTSDVQERVALLPRLLGEVFYHLLPVFPPALIVGGLSWKFLLQLSEGRVAKEEVEALTRGLEGNVTTQMDLELGDLADELRKVPALVTIMKEGDPTTAIARCATEAGAENFLEGWKQFMQRYGHRCPGEIDASRPRWHENPTSLVLSLRGMLASPESGRHREKEILLRKQAEAAKVSIVAAMRGGIFGGLRARLAARLADNVRTYLALREHGKYFAMMIVDEAHRIATAAGEALCARGVLNAANDVFFLEVEEIAPLMKDVVRSAERDQTLRTLIQSRRQSTLQAKKKDPPRLLTSTGEAPAAPPPANLPEGALGGIGASSGVIEGTARVVLDPNAEVLLHGEILIAPFTDPGWTPLFVHAAGLVMEVGGLITHGSVVAREYGIPAVVGVDKATRLIKSGDRIRVDGTHGTVVVLSGAHARDEQENLVDSARATS